MTPNDNMYYIWCRERNMWWKDRAWGYTSDIRDAGLFREHEALQYTQEANSNGSVEDLMVSEESVRLLRHSNLHGL